VEGFSGWGQCWPGRRKVSNTPPQYYDLIESAIAGNKNDLRTLLQQLSQNDTQIQGALGIASSTSNANVAAPPQGSLSVTGANGVFTGTITPPKLTTPATLYHRVSYSTVKGFTSNVTVMQSTTATGFTVNLPGQALFFRLESSFNNMVFNQPVLAAQNAVSSGLVSSAATSAGGAFNQTNLGVVTSEAVGATAAVQVQGAAGPLTSMPVLKGGTQSTLPGATIIGVEPRSNQFVGSISTPSGPDYILRPTLGSLLDDGVTPIGKVSVVGTGTPTLPTIVPIISGGNIIAYNVTAGGAGASSDYTLTVSDSGGPGTGATTGAQTIVGGVLISVAPGNPGSNYDGSTTVTASGGIFPGQDGGGTAQAGNGGRLTNV
jgi:hypothetical protein